MKKDKIFMDEKNCIGYGFWIYVSDTVSKYVIDFLDNFSMWGSHTKTYKNYYGYEMAEDTINFMKTDTFRSFCAKKNIDLITSKDVNYVNLLSKEVFENHISN